MVARMRTTGWTLATCLTAVGVGLSILLFTIPGLSPYAFVRPAGHRADSCIAPPQNGSRTVLLAATDTSLSLPASLPFCITESVTFVGGWVASEPTAAAVLFQNEIQYAWPCPGCYSTNGTFNETLFPGSYGVYLMGGGTGGSVSVVQPFELIFDRATDILQPTGTVTVSAGQTLSWPFAIPNGSSRPAVYSSENVSTGFYAGVMTPSQVTAFHADPSSFSWYSVPWFTYTSGGVSGPAIAGSMCALPGNYFLVFYNDNSVPSSIHFTTPLYLAYTSG
ncbi:MAG: hypothetical protein ACLQD8_03535 [Thermoplasmata archaeon]